MCETQKKERKKPTRDTDLKVAVLGLGHIGLPTALGLADFGWDVVGVDNDITKARRIAGGEVPFYEEGVEELLHKHLDTGKFRVSTDVTAAMREATILFVCVGTPQREDGAADLSMVDKVARDISASLNGYKLIIEKSTTPVQTAQHIKRSILRYLGANGAGERKNDNKVDFDVAVNPEFLREGTGLYDFFHPDRIVLGVESERARDLLLRLYQPLLDRNGTTAEASVVVTDVNTAEIIKHASNAFLSTKISFINMVSDLCEKTGANVDDVARGLGLDKRIGPAFLKAGIGFGGYCFPKDLRAFRWIAAQHGVDFSLLREVERINETRVEHLMAKLRQALWVVKGKTLAVWGLAFKPMTDDIREAPNIKVVSALLKEEANLRLFDPKAMNEFKRVIPEKQPAITYCSSPEEAARGADTIVVLTDWPQFLSVDMEAVRDSMAVRIVVDGRNMFKPEKMRELGFDYYSIGRP